MDVFYYGKDRKYDGTKRVYVRESEYDGADVIDIEGHLVKKGEDCGYVPGEFEVVPDRVYDRGLMQRSYTEWP